MFFFKKNENDHVRVRREPNVIKLTDNLLASIWHSEREDGGVRFDWCLTRMSSAGDRLCKSLRVRDLIEAPAALATLAEQFASVPTTPAELRERLQAMSKALASVSVPPAANGLVVPVNGLNSNPFFRATT